MRSDVALESPVARATPMSSSRRGLEAPRTTDSLQPRKATAAEPAKAEQGQGHGGGNKPRGHEDDEGGYEQPRAGIDAEHARVGHVVAGDALQKAPGKRQPHAHQKRGEHPGQAQVHQGVGEALAGRAGEDLPQLL